ncbi:MAG: 50S ribosomal protein L28 [candidate division Zixibacteria bacterium]|nr:50S ribosomal protein L28 [candidate division Zixibacteria bacterium]
MAKSCDICGKSYIRGHKVSHSNNRTLRRWNPNLQNVKTKIGQETRYIRACTSCIKAGKVLKAV